MIYVNKFVQKTIDMAKLDINKSIKIIGKILLAKKVILWLFHIIIILEI